jgi:hypothetical protein
VKRQGIDYIRPYIVITRDHAEALFPEWPTLVDGCGKAILDMGGPVILRIHEPRAKDRGRHHFTFEAPSNNKTLTMWRSRDEVATAAFKNPP